MKTMNAINTMLKRSAMLLWLVGVLSCGKPSVDHGRNQAYALSDGGRAVVFRDGEVRVYDGQGVERYRVLTGNRHAVMGAEGRYLLLQAEGGGTVEVQDLVEGKRERVPAVHVGEVAAWTMVDGYWVLVERTGMVHQGKTMARFLGTRLGSATAFGIHREGTEVAFGDGRGELERVELGEGEARVVQRVQVEGVVTQMVYGARVWAVGTDRGRVFVYRRLGAEKEFGSTAEVYEGTGKVVELGVSEDEKAVWVVNDSGEAQVYVLERPGGLRAPCLRVELSGGLDSMVIRSGELGRLKSEGLFGVLRSGEGAQVEVKNLCTEKTYDPGMGHQDYVNGVAFLGDKEETVVSASGDGTLAEWDGTTGQLLRRFVGHTDTVNSLAVWKAGKMMVSGSGDGTAKVWKMGERALGMVQVGAEKTFEHGDYVRSVAVSPDETKLVTGGLDGMAKVWDLNDPSGMPIPQKTFVHGDLIWSVAVSPDGTKLVTGGQDGMAKVWDLNDPNRMPIPQKTFDHGDIVYRVAVSPDRTKLVTGGQDGMAKVWDLNDPSGMPIPQKTFDHGELIWSVAVFSVKEGNQEVTKLVTGGEDGTAKVWNVSTGVLEKTFVHGSGVYSVPVSSKGTELLTGGNDGVVKRWEMAKEMEPKQTLQSPIRDQWGFPFMISAGWFNDSRRVLLRLYQDAILWNLETRQVEQQLPVPKSTYISAVAVSRDNLWVAVGRDDGIVMLWRQDGMRFVHHSDLRMSRRVESIVFSSDGKRMLVTDRSQVTECTWTGTGWTAGKNWKSMGGLLAFASYAPKGDRVVVLDDRAWTVQILDWSQAAPNPVVGSMHKGSAPYTSAAFSPDGRFVYVSSDRGKDLLLSMDSSAVELPFRTGQALWMLDGKAVATMTNGKVSLLTVESLRNATFVPLGTADFFLPVSGGLSASEDGRTVLAMSNSGVSLRFSLHPPVVTQATVSNLR